MVGVPTFKLTVPLLAVIVVAAASVLGLRVTPDIDGALVNMSTVARVVLAVAGLAGLLRWRLDSLSRSFWFGFAAIAAAIPLLTLSSGWRTLDAMSFAAALVTIPLAWFACRAPEVDATLRYARTVAWAVPLAGLGFVIGSIDSPSVDLVRDVVVAVALLALAARMVVGERAGRIANGRWFLPTLVATAISQVGTLLLPAGTSDYAVSGPMMLVGAGLALTGAMAELHVAAARHQGLVLAATIARDDEVARRAQQEAEVASQLHEVRSRVAAIEGGVTVMRAGESADDLSVAVSLEIERLRKLVAPTVPATVGPFNVLDALRPTLVVAASSWPVDFEVPEDLMAIGRADDLAQVVHGLVHNATKYAPGSPIVVTASRDGEHVLVMVDDHGPGVARGERDLIFERGWKRAQDGDGFGLGLAIARDLMATSRGDLWVAPRPGGGARFTASLPAWGGLSAVDDGTTTAPPSDSPDLSDADRAQALRRLRGNRGAP
jgi:signal transduction histidine kinase